MIVETTTLGIILAVISCVALLLVLTLVASRKFSQGLCMPLSTSANTSTPGNVCHQVIASAPRTSYETYPFNKLSVNEEETSFSTSKMFQQHSSQVQSNEEVLNEYFDEKMEMIERAFKQGNVASSKYSAQQQKHVIYKASFNEEV